MADFATTVGATRPAIVETLRDAYGPINLTGCTVTFNATKNGVTYVNAASCTLTDAINGIVTYVPLTTDFTEPGEYLGRFEVTYPAAGGNQFFPSGRYFTVEVVGENNTYIPPTGYNLTETIQDVVGAMTTAGTDISVTYNDTAGTVTIAVTGVSGTGSTLSYTPARDWSVDLVAGTNPTTVKAALDELELYLEVLLNTSHAATLAALSGDATADFDWNNNKLTSVTAGTATGQAAIWDQTPAGLFTTKGDTLVATAAHTAARKAAPADGKFRGGLASQSDGWVDIDLPWRDNHLAWVGYFNTNNGTPTVTQDSAALGGGVIRATTNQNDHMEWKVWLGVGTYTLTLFGTAAANAPILTCTLDGTSVGTLDYYNAGTFKNTKAEITGISVGTPGLYEFKVTAATRNASNTTGWIQQLNCFAFKRTS